MLPLWKLPFSNLQIVNKAMNLATCTQNSDNCSVVLYKLKLAKSSLHKLNMNFHLLVAIHHMPLMPMAQNLLSKIP